MATSAVHAFKTQIKKGSASGGTAIVNVGDIGGPALARDVIDATNQLSADGAGSGWREKLPGLKDGGQITFTIHYKPTEATHSALTTDFADGSSDAYGLEWIDGGAGYYADFTAFVSGFAITAPVDEKLTAEVTLTITGPVTFS